MLEDDLEHLHQTSKRISDLNSRMKNKMQKAISHSKKGAKLNNKEIMRQQQQWNQMQSVHLRNKNQMQLLEVSWNETAIV